MSTILIQKQIRTEPKLPTITNKNLTILPWDWELPSTILKSEWAKKHNQCVLGFYDESRNSYCGQGLLLHYYGWKGEGHPTGIVDSNIMNASYRKMFEHSDFSRWASYHFHQLSNLNDNCLLNFDQLGDYMKAEGQ